MEIRARILNSVVIPDFGTFTDVLKKFEGKDVKIKITSPRESRDIKTVQQLRAVHGVIRELANGLGYHFEEMKYNLKRHLKGYDFDDNGKYLKSFEKYTKSEMRDFIEKLEYFANQEGFDIKIGHDNEE